jgi:low molecular weight phosphotyrosine protein phosphatase
MFYSVIFVCTGNICRSPMAEAVFKALVKERQQEALFSKIESAGTTAYHVGEEADDRTLTECARNGVPIDCRATRFKTPDYESFTHIVSFGHLC